MADGIVLSLMDADLNILAQSASTSMNMDTENDKPVSLSINYIGSIASDTELLVCITALSDDKIVEKRLQIGYKLYGEHFPLLDEPDTSCI